MDGEHRPHVEALVVLGDDGNPSFSLTSQRVKSDADFELLIAALVNGINMQLGHVADHRGLDRTAMLARINRLIAIMAQGNDQSPQRFVAQKQDDDDPTSPPKLDPPPYDPDGRAELDW